MSNEFTREARYMVLKSADAMKCLTVSELIELRRIQAKVEEHRAEIGKPPLDCVVVESDWPEYESTWRAIEARVTGAQPAPSMPECPYPCGWQNLLKHVMGDGAYLARSINEDEPVTENARAVTMRMVMRLRDVLMAINNTSQKAKP